MGTEKSKTIDKNRKMRRKKQKRKRKYKTKRNIKNRLKNKFTNTSLQKIELIKSFGGEIYIQQNDRYSCCHNTMYLFQMYFSPSALKKKTPTSSLSISKGQKYPLSC